MRIRHDFVLLIVVAACKQVGPGADSTSARDSTLHAPPIVADARIGTPNPQGAEGEWTMPARDYASSRYSTLTQITSANAKNLKAAWTFSTGVLRGHEGQPLVVNKTMYLVTPYPNVAYAIDLTQPGYPLKWKFRPENAQAAVGTACCDVVNRGAAITMAPIVVKNRVIVGSSGGEMGVRGWIAALDLATGRELWRAYNTGPDADVKIGARFKPFYATERGKDLGLTSWPGDAWKIGGGAVWGWLSYDPALNLVYHGTSNPGPWNQDVRPGDNKWTCVIFARDAATGELVWAFQVTPHDLWDYDAVNENILVDLPVNGQQRKVLVHFDRNGFAYTMDRATGQVL